MEWVEITAKTLEAARDMALDRLGVAEDEAEIEVLEEPRAGLFGRIRGEARVRARVRPTAVRPKQERRGRTGKARAERSDAAPGRPDADSDAPAREHVERETAAVSTGDRSRGRQRTPDRQRPTQRKERPAMDANTESTNRSRDDRGSDDGDDGPGADPQAVGDAAVEFMTGLAAAFGMDATAALTVDGSDLDVQLNGDDLGLLIGPGGRTLAAVQDLVRVAAQRRLGDHETRLRIDVAGYRERRREALEKFATAVANEVIAAGRGKALEPMPSADRKVVHDAIQAIDGVTSHSDGEEPRRRVVIVPA
jgi:spoIIIJ-associated protein